MADPDSAASESETMSSIKRPKIVNPSPNSEPRFHDPTGDESQEEHHPTMDGSDYPSRCGICLIDEGKPSRGYIDSCNHYFCFVCIMEWAKVESKCPLCKRRFTQIRRPPKHGVFPLERIVNVPERNQVYHPLGNISTGPSDPYSDVKCGVCGSMSDESLLLLCDLCDSASHTYCVGLGVTVPEGDWLCQDCNTSSTEHIDIMEIVEIPEAVRVTSQVSSDKNKQSPPTIRDDGINAANKSTEQCTHSLENGTSNMKGVDSRTLRHRRNVQSRIQALRENWDALRNGSLTFSTSFVNCSSSSSLKRKNKNMLYEDESRLHSRSRPPSSSSFKKCLQSTTQNHNAGSTILYKGSDDITKAWQMMDKAKRVCKKTRAVPKSTLTPFHGGRDLEKVANSCSGDTSKNQLLGDHGRAEMGKQSKYYFDDKNVDKHNVQKSDKQKSCVITMEKSIESSDVPQSTYLQGHRDVVASKYVSTSIQGDACHIDKMQPLQKDMKGDSSNNRSKQHEFASLKTQVKAFSEASNSFSYGMESARFSSHMVGTPSDVDRLERSHPESRIKQDDGKGEIQALVRLNVKLLSRDKPLGVDEFKVIARASTHSILAACGLEHSKHKVRSIPSCKCSHLKFNHQFSKTSLLPNCCRGCFYVFVKDVVNSIMYEKLDSAKISQNHL